MNRDTIFYIDPQSYRNLSTYDYSVLSKIRDFNIHYLCSKHYDNKKHEWVAHHPVFSYNHIKNKALKACCYIFNYLQVLMLIVRYRPALIHLQWVRLPHFDYRFYQFVKAVFKTRVVYTAHNILPLFIGDSQKELYGKIYHGMTDHIIVHTEDTKSQMIQLFGLKENKISVIQHGALKMEYDPKLYERHKDDYDKKYRLDGLTAFTCLGEQCQYKATDILADVWASTPELNQNNHCRLILVGRQRDVDLTRLKQFDNVIIDNRMIPHEEYYYLLTHADVFILTYRKKSFSQSGALMTALTENVPVLVSEVGGLTDPLKIADIGWCISDVCEKNQLRDMLIHILKNTDKIKSIKADSQGWEKVHQFYAWDRISLQTQALYHAVINQ